jgi:hypothetical protein
MRDNIDYGPNNAAANDRTGAGGKINLSRFAGTVLDLPIKWT